VSIVEARLFVVHGEVDVGDADSGFDTVE